jgi:hypothetical protein
MSEMLETVLKAIRRCDHLYTLVRLLRLRFSFKFKVKYALPMPFTSIQTPTTPLTLIRLSIPYPYPTSIPTHSLCIKSQLPSSPAYPIRSFPLPIRDVHTPCATPGARSSGRWTRVLVGRCVISVSGAGWCSFLYLRMFVSFVGVLGVFFRVWGGGGVGGVGRRSEERCWCLSHSDDLLVAARWILFER